MSNSSVMTGMNNGHSMSGHTSNPMSGQTGQSMSGQMGQSMSGNTGQSMTGHMGHSMAGHTGPMPSMALVDLAEVTHTAVQSGDWSDPSTWAGGRIPDDAARAHIPDGLTVTVDGVFSAELKTLRVDGTLDFATDVDTELRVDTLVTTTGSHLSIGTETTPISADVTAKIVFSDDGAIDQTWDPSLISRGALIHGKTTIAGAEKLAFTSLETPALAGSTSITLSEEPTGWRVGDEITIAGTEAGNPLGDEVVTIAQIDGRTITFEQALADDHVPPRADLDVHVANLTRNVQFSSENSEAGHAGHVMFMHTNDADVRHFSTEGLGRTDKAAGVDDWQLVSPSEGSIGEELTEVVDLGGDNVRGRYSIHFHRGGDEGPAARVEGAVVRDDPGWAYVNHSSNVDFVGNVSHNVVGAAYNTEAGDEVGSFVGNIAIRTFNPNGNPNPPDFEVNEDQSPDIRVLTQDFGWQGDGFWLHGPGVTVDDNVVTGASGHAYIYWPLGLVEEGSGEALAEVAIDGVQVEVRPKHVEVPSFDGNVAYVAPKALNIAYLHTDNRDDNDEHQELENLLTEVPQSFEDQLQSTFSNFTAWNIELNAIAAPYSGRLTFENIDVTGTGEGGSIGIKLDQFDNENDITVRNVTIDGFDVGLAAQRQGEGLIDGARIVSGVSDIRISLPDGAPRELEIRNVEHLNESIIYSDLSERVEVSLESAHDLGLAGGLFGDDEGFFDEDHLIGVPPIFLPDSITYETTDGEVVGLYFDIQDPNFVPVVQGGELSRFVPEELVGLTNAELYEQFGFSTGGAPAPSNATTGFVEGGFTGTPAATNASYPPEPNPYWVDFLAEFGVDIPWPEVASAQPGAGNVTGNAGNDVDENSEPPAVGGDAPDTETPVVEEDETETEVANNSTEEASEDNSDQEIAPEDGMSASGDDNSADDSSDISDPDEDTALGDEAISEDDLLYDDEDDDDEEDDDTVFLAPDDGDDEPDVEVPDVEEDEEDDFAFMGPDEGDELESAAPDEEDLDASPEGDREELDRLAEQAREEEEDELAFGEDDEHLFIEMDADEEDHAHEFDDELESAASDEEDLDASPEGDREELDRLAEQAREEEEDEFAFGEDDEHLFIEMDADEEDHAHEFDDDDELESAASDEENLDASPEGDREELDRLAEQAREAEEDELAFGEDDEHLFIELDAESEDQTQEVDAVVETYGEEDQWLLDLMAALMRDEETHSEAKYLAYEEEPEPYEGFMEWFF